MDKLRDLHNQLDKRDHPKAGYAHHTVRQAAEDWLASGLDGRSPKMVKKNQNVLEPMLKVAGVRKLARPVGGRRATSAGLDRCRVFQRGGDDGAPGAEARHPARPESR